eukprot:CAMPEP_0201605990 /NCGR_PEP_ID=MMETSP0492-20130828/5610_1 /ASSEMBLY_ACC=CAM_ASM_000837 /TAXON_ID=420259 /ORGANISM="Thalassiosira gravida, Strain GMp14c1" /LENGTH=96 /DNA_ID=CAMNT_0048070323 /DNA_START=310 /DNA_END=600 /DNA_ORIENTATION=-
MVSNDGKIHFVSKGDNLLRHHKRYIHHGGMAVIQLDDTFRKNLLLIKVIPAKFNVAITEVTNEIISSSLNVAHEGSLQPSNEGDYLNKIPGEVAYN